MLAVELPHEEVALLLGTLTACGFLILGVLEILWPARPRRGVTRPARSASSRSTSSRARLAPVAVRRIPSPAAGSASAHAAPVPLTSAPREIDRPAPAAASAVQIARLLLDRAATEADLDRRVTILNRAVAGLTRSAQAAPEDEALSTMLTTTRALLWETWERIAQARLAAAMPWSGEVEAAAILSRTR